MAVAREFHNTSTKPGISGKQPHVNANHHLLIIATFPPPSPLIQPGQRYFLYSPQLSQAIGCVDSPAAVRWRNVAVVKMTIHGIY